MASTDQTTTITDAGGDPPRRRPAWITAFRRVGPILAVAVVMVAAVGGCYSDDGDDEAGGSEEAATDLEELIRSGPMTPERAELEGVEVDFGDGCDLETGRIKMPTVYAPPCVEPFEGDNGGATSMGVTEDSIKIIAYRADPALDPLASGLIAGAGADVDPESAQQTLEDFVGPYNELFETYGRTVEVEFFTGTGAGDDAEAARADAIAIAEREPFAVIGGPTQSGPVFSSELASREVICGPGCGTAVPEELVLEYAPFIWTAGPTPDQGAALAAEMVGKLAGPGKAELAGSDEMRERDRVYAVLHYDNPDGDHQPVFEAMEEALAENGVELATDIEFALDPARAQENARTIIGRLMDAEVTTIIYYGDPLTPPSLTEEATAQGYFPEWILGPNVLMDTTLFARQTDVDQWKNGFGLSLPAARGAQETNGAFLLYDWLYGTEPPNNTINVIEPPLRSVFSGIHLAGPELTPETFRDGYFRAPVSGGGPTQAQVSRGDHGVWPDLDWGGSDDMALIWFDPEATGEDEVGTEGVGMYRYANGGQRYSIGNLPESFEEAGLFDDEASVTVFDEVPEEDTTPEYEPPATG